MFGRMLNRSDALAPDHIWYLHMAVEKFHMDCKLSILKPVEEATSFKDTSLISFPYINYRLKTFATRFWKSDVTSNWILSITLALWMQIIIQESLCRALSCSSKGCKGEQTSCEIQPIEWRFWRHQFSDVLPLHLSGRQLRSPPKWHHHFAASR